MKMRINVTVEIDENEIEDGQTGEDIADLVTDSLDQFFWDQSFVGDVGPISIQVTN